MFCPFLCDQMGYRLSAFNIIWSARNILFLIWAVGVFCDLLSVSFLILMEKI